MALPIPDILQLLPQAPPFIMVDELLHSYENAARSRFIINSDNCLTDNGRFTEAGLLENIAQTAAAHAGYQAYLLNKPVDGGYIASVKNFEVHLLPETGSELITEIKVEQLTESINMITGTIRCNDEIVATGELRVVVANAGGKTA